MRNTGIPELTYAGTLALQRHIDWTAPLVGHSCVTANGTRIA